MVVGKCGCESGVAPSSSGRTSDRALLDGSWVRDSVAKWIKALGWMLLTLSALGATATGPKRVLLLYSFGRGYEPSIALDTAFRMELAQQFKVPIELHEASLETPRFVAGESQKAVVAYL